MMSTIDKLIAALETPGIEIIIRVPPINNPASSNMMHDVILDYLKTGVKSNEDIQNHVASLKSLPKYKAIGHCKRNDVAWGLVELQNSSRKRGSSNNDGKGPIRKTHSKGLLKFYEL